MQWCYNGMISRNAERAQKRLKRVNLRESRTQGVHSLHLCKHICFIFFFFLIWSQQKLTSAPRSTWWRKDAHPQLPRPHVVVPGMDAWMGWHKQFHSLALCSNSKPLGKTDLVHTSGSHSWSFWNSSVAAVTPLLKVRWKLKEWSSQFRNSKKYLQLL